MSSNSDGQARRTGERDSAPTPRRLAQRYVSVNVYRVDKGFRVAVMVKETNGRTIRLVRPALIYPVDGENYTLAAAAVVAAQALIAEFGDDAGATGPLPGLRGS